MRPLALVLLAFNFLHAARGDSCVQLGRAANSSHSSASFWCAQTPDGACEHSDGDNFSVEELREFVDTVASSHSTSVMSKSVDPSTIRNKVLAGYQGWVGAEGDTIHGYGWRHWTETNPKVTPSSTNAHFEMLPELGEYPSSALYKSKLHYVKNGKTVELYSNAGEGVVDLHFKWMADYGLDGVLLQRFVSEVQKSGPAQEQRNTILAQMDKSAAHHGRTYAVMWDMSGFKDSAWEDAIKNDFKKYVKKYTSSHMYLKEGGKPVVCIFGIGLHDRTTAAPPSSSLSLIKWLQGEGLYVIGSGPYYWRTGGHDAGTGYDKVHAAFDAIMPWSVGRYKTVSDFGSKVLHVTDDAATTSKRGQHYAPIAYAGYSYRDAHKFNLVKRNGGKFFQAQIDAYLKTPGATFYYVAMFDEIQEGTAIYKMAANEDESAQPKGCFVTMSIDGVQCPGDHYLKMTGQFASRAHGLKAQVASVVV